MKVLRLPRLKVHVGSPLPWNVRDEHGLLLLSRGNVVDTDHQLELLLQRGAFVDAEEVRATARDAQPAQALAIVSPPNIFDLWDQTTDALKKLVTEDLQQPGFVGQMDQFARHILELVDLNADIGIYRIVRQDNAKHFYYGPHDESGQGGAHHEHDHSRSAGANGRTGCSHERQTAGPPVARTVRRDTGQSEHAIVANVADRAMLMRLPPERLYGFSAAPHP